MKLYYRNVRCTALHPKRKHLRNYFKEKIHKEGETIEELVTDLNLKSSSLQFCEAEFLIRDQITTGIWNKKLRETTVRPKINPSQSN